VSPFVAYLPDQPDRLEPKPLGQVPVVEGVCNRPMKFFVARSFGTYDHQFGVSLPDRPEYSGGTGEVTPCHYNTTLGGRVKAIGTPQEIEPTAVSRSVAPEYEGDWAVPAPESLKHRPPVGVVGAGHHLVVGTVAST
jgi:hypothetical protein